MTTTSETLADTVVNLLRTAGVADGNVYGLRAWPTQQDQLPQVQLALPEEDKTAPSRGGAPQFTVVATLPLLITVQTIGAEDEEGAAQARGQLADIGRKIERAVIGHPDLMRQIQRVAFVKSHGRVDGRGEEVAGQRVIMLGFEFYQGPEDFYVEEYEPLEQADVTLDAIHPADTAGTYPAAAYAVDPAPRASGPDGRVEARALIDLTS